MRAEEDMLDWKILNPLIDKLEDAAQNSEYIEIRSILTTVVSGYSPQSGIKDLLFKEIDEWFRCEG